MSKNSEVSPDKGTVVQRTSDFEIVVTRTFNAPSHLVYRAWTQPELFQQWWVPKSQAMKIVSCEMDVQLGGRYRLEIVHPAFDHPMAFFGTYREVLPNRRLVWTNEESADGAITTVTFTETDGATKVTMSNCFPTAQALEAELATGAADCTVETLVQLEDLLAQASEG